MQLFIPEWDRLTQSVTDEDDQKFLLKVRQMGGEVYEPPTDISALRRRLTYLAWPSLRIGATGVNERNRDVTPTTFSFLLIAAWFRGSMGRERRKGCASVSLFLCLES